MTDKIIINPHNGVYDKLFTTNEGIEQELSDHFSFFVHNYRFMPSYGRWKVVNGKKQFVRTGWDGKHRLYKKKNIILRGLTPEVEKFCAKHGYEFQSDLVPPDQITKQELVDFVKSLNLPKKIEVRDYQYKAVYRAINDGIRVLESSVSSGKSLIIYILARWYKHKTLIVVPTVNLVNQLASDFEEYGNTVPIHKIFQGQERAAVENITISTWQSLILLERGFFEQFSNVIVDETHRAQSKSFQYILENSTEAYNRIGLTGSMKETETDKMVIEGMLGPSIVISKARELIERGFLAPFTVNCIELDHGKKKFPSYHDEIDFIVRNQERNRLLIKLASNLKGNIMLLFNFEDQGKQLLDLANDIYTNEVFYIQGKVKADERERIRKHLNDLIDSLLIASIKTTGIGVNIPSIDHVILGTPSKSREVIIQAIGRVLRKNGRNAVLWDVSDDFGGNYTWKHYQKRLATYDAEQHPYKIKRIKGIQ